MRHAPQLPVASCVALQAARRWVGPIHPLDNLLHVLPIMFQVV